MPSSGLSPIIHEPFIYTLPNNFDLFMAYVNLSESILISSMRATRPFHAILIIFEVIF